MSLEDIDELAGKTSAALEELKTTKAELEKYKYETEHLEARLHQAEALLANIRKRMFWRNDIELMKLIDDFTVEVSDDAEK